MASLSHAQSSIVDPVVHPRTRTKPKPKTKTRTRTRSRARARGGIVWITVFGVLLAGVIAINVAGLQQRMKLNKLTQERAQLLSQIPDDAARLSTQRSDGRVGTAARRAGLVPAAPDATSYLRLGK